MDAELRARIIDLIARNQFQAVTWADIENGLSTLPDEKKSRIVELIKAQQGELDGYVRDTLLDQIKVPITAMVDQFIADGAIPLDQIGTLLKFI